MTTYYFDVETLVPTDRKPEPNLDTIISIQYQPFWDDSGNPKEPLTILKSWKSSEQHIVHQFLQLTGWDHPNPYPFRFIPAGVNLSYDLLVLAASAQDLLGIELAVEYLWREQPKIDLKTVLVLANRGQFKGSSLHNFSSKQQSGKTIVDVVKEQDWETVERYVCDEAQAFQFNHWTIINN